MYRPEPLPQQACCQIGVRFPDAHACITECDFPFEQRIQHFMAQLDLCFPYHKAVFGQQCPKNVFHHGMCLFKRRLLFHTAFLQSQPPLTANGCGAEHSALRRTDLTSTTASFSSSDLIFVPYLQLAPRTHGNTAGGSIAYNHSLAPQGSY